MVNDDDFRPKVLSLYERGKGIRSIARALHLGDGSVRRILKESGVETILRTNRTVPTLKHPYTFYDVMEQKGWTVNMVCEQLRVGKSSVQQWRRDGLPWQKADEVAIGMGFMPQDLWDNWFDFEDELV